MGVEVDVGTNSDGQRYLWDVSNLTPTTVPQVP